MILAHFIALDYRGVLSYVHMSCPCLQFLTWHPPGLHSSGEGCCMALLLLPETGEVKDRYKMFLLPCCLWLGFCAVFSTWGVLNHFTKWLCESWTINSYFLSLSCVLLKCIHCSPGINWSTVCLNSCRKSDFIYIAAAFLRKLMLV